MATTSIIRGVAEITRTAGTGTYALGGAVTGAYTFDEKVNDGDKVVYEVKDYGGGVEHVKGTFTSPNLVTRDLIISSSNSDAAVDWPDNGIRIISLLFDLDALLPPGGIKGDILRKISSIDYDTQWEGAPYPVAMFIPNLMLGGTDDDRTRARILITDDVIFERNFEGSLAHARVAATADYVYQINKIFVDESFLNIGTLTFPAGETEGVLTSTGGGGTGEPITIEALRMIEIFGQATADLTLKDMSVTFKGRRL